MATFIDMFAGAGGFSEGFLQAEYKGNYFDFLLASDINPTCEVTHYMRYNLQLGLNTAFLTKDISDPDFIEVLLATIKHKFGDKEIDVLTGGPPCQSFSLAGERRKNDKKDDLFSYYLKVIGTLKPKYFIMENVAGILTKDNCRIKERILREIRNIMDYSALDRFIKSVEKAMDINHASIAELNLCIKVLKIWQEDNRLIEERRNDYLTILENLDAANLSSTQRSFLEASLLENKNTIANSLLEELCTSLSSQLVDAFRNDKQTTEDERNVIRQAISLISKTTLLNKLQYEIKKQINTAQLKRSIYKTQFDQITDWLNLENIIDIAKTQCDKIISSSTNSKAKAVLPYLEANSSIINTTSITAFAGKKNLIDYSATKGAIMVFTKSLALSLADQKIRVNAVAPGPIWTPLIPSSFNEQEVEIFGTETPLKRAGQPFELAPAYLYLASDDSRYVTGQVIHVNGGTII